jgi:hypothetical protein
MVFTDTVSNPTMGVPHAQTGDGRPYTAAEWRLFWKYIFARGNADRGVLKGVLNEAVVTVTGANALQVGTGVIMCAGGVVVMETAETLAPASAGAGLTRKDSVVCELDLDNSGVGQYKVRVKVLQGTAGAYPTLTQNIATRWDIRLYNYIIDDAGAITSLSDQRQYLRFAGDFDHGDLLGLADDDHPQYYNAARLTAGAVNALGIDAATVGGLTAAQLMGGVALGFKGVSVDFCGALGGSDGHRPIDVITGTAHEDWHWANGDLVNGVQTLDSRGKVTMGSDGPAGTYPVGATGGASTINIEHTHANGTLDTATENTHTHGTAFTIQNGGAHSHPLAGTGMAASSGSDHVHSMNFKSGVPSGISGAVTPGAGMSFFDGGHKHDVTGSTTVGQGSHQHGLTGDTGAASPATHGHTLTGNTSAGAAHKHTISGAIANAGSTTQAILPPYRAWYKITYVA